MAVEAAPALASIAVPVPVAAPVLAPATAAPPGAQASRELNERLTRERGIKLAQDEIKSGRAALAAEREKHKALVDSAGKKDLAGAMRAMGYSEEEIATHAAEKGLPDPTIEALRRELAETKALATGVKTEAEQRIATEAKKQQDAANTAYRTEFIGGLEAQKDKYPHLAAYQGGASVLAEVQAAFKRTGKAPTEAEVDAIAASVEDRIAKQLPTRLGSILKFPKVFDGFKAALEAEGYVVTKKDAVPVAAPERKGTKVTHEADEAPVEKTAVRLEEKAKKKSPDQLWKDIQAKNKLAKV